MAGVVKGVTKVVVHIDEAEKQMRLKEKREKDKASQAKKAKKEVVGRLRENVLKMMIRGLSSKPWLGRGRLWMRPIIGDGTEASAL